MPGWRPVIAPHCSCFITRVLQPPGCAKNRGAEGWARFWLTAFFSISAPARATCSAYLAPCCFLCNAVAFEAGARHQRPGATMENQQDSNFLFSPASAQTLRERAQLVAQRHSFAVMVFLGVVFLGSLIFLLTRASLQGSEINASSSLTAGAPIAPLGVAQPDSASPDPFEGTATLSVASRPTGANALRAGDLGRQAGQDAASALGSVPP